jgi:Sulfate permease family
LSGYLTHSHQELITPKRFNGVVNLDVRDSVPDWTPFREQPAPANAPNVLIVLYDDTGLAAWSPMSTAATVILTLLFLAPVFSYLPQAALGALVFVAGVGLVDISSLRHILSVERRDGVLAIIAALAVIATGALYGMVGAVLLPGARPASNGPFQTCLPTI